MQKLHSCMCLIGCASQTIVRNTPQSWAFFCFGMLCMYDVAKFNTSNTLLAPCACMIKLKALTLILHSVQPLLPGYATLHSDLYEQYAVLYIY